ncbi:MAG: hypothetical protein JXB39_07325 [Deltaproteobacteria bacterium]|nr:hypothetical protein [Deltaproteobacteria bacterium]
MTRGALLVPALALLVPACAREALSPTDEPDADVRVELQDRAVDEGDPARVRVWIRQVDGATVEVGEPAAEGMTAHLEAEREEPVEGGTITVREWTLAGPPGSYVVQVPEATARYPDGRTVPLPVPPLFVDVGVEGPSSDLEDLLQPVPEPPARWPWIVAGVAALGVAVGVLGWMWKRRRRTGPAAAPEPPDAVALRDWNEALEDPALDDHGRALRLSAVFRAYLEAVHRWPASALTTREIADALYRDGLVSAALLDGARRVLHATDLVKFARQQGGTALFRSLDEDFRAYVLATRPQEAPAGEGRGS